MCFMKETIFNELEEEESLSSMAQLDITTPEAHLFRG